VVCGAAHDKREVHFRCRICGQSLELIYDYREIAGKISWKLLRARPFRLWRYREFFPIIADQNIITLGEGGTPLLRSRALGKSLDFTSLLFKYEGANPSGSFKDRGTTVEISKALEFKIGAVACASTGNMGASVAAYSSAAGIRCKIYVPRGIAGPKIAQIAAHGAQIVRIGGEYTDALRAATAEFEAKGTYLMGDYPYRGAGEKSVAFEITDQIGVPDYVVCPIGNGTLIASVWKGFKELKATRLTKRLPRMFGVQAAGCCPVVRAFLDGADIIRPVRARTAASAIACGDPIDGTKALAALAESDGLAAAVSDSEMRKAKKLLAAREGIYAELSAAAPLAGLIKLKDQLKGDARIVLVVTGHGLKD
jgi:threonine synthase